MGTIMNKPVSVSDMRETHIGFPKSALLDITVLKMHLLLQELLNHFTDHGENTSARRGLMETIAQSSCFHERLGTTTLQTPLRPGTCMISWPCGTKGTGLMGIFAIVGELAGSAVEEEGETLELIGEGTERAGICLGWKLGKRSSQSSLKLAHIRS